MQATEKDVMPVMVTATTTCGLDIHRDKIDACIRINDGTLDGKLFEKTFNTARGALIELRNWILSFKCFKVLMESTGVYWMPIFFLLEEITGMDVGVGNSRHTKNTPGRPKTDKDDARWLSRLCMLGYLLKSFIVAKPFRDLREYTRYHKKLVQEQARHKNRIEKLLQMNGFKLSSVLSDITGVSGIRILSKLCEQGSLTVADISAALDCRVRKSAEEVEYAINGVMKPTSRVLLRKQLTKLAASNKEIEEIYQCMVELSKEHSRAIEIISSIPGLSDLSAIYIIAETGTDMSSFKTSGHLVAWAGLAPKGDQSADKESPKKTKKANRYLKTILVECARAATLARSSRVAMWYWSRVNKLGDKKATVAIARKLLCYVYAMLKNDTLYDASLDRAQEQNNRAKKLDSARKIVDGNKGYSEKKGSSVSLAEKLNASPDNQLQSNIESASENFDTSSVSPVLSQPCDEKQQSVVVMPVKKKRGRPKKNLDISVGNHNKHSMSLSPPGISQPDGENMQDVNIPVSKNNGRTRKNTTDAPVVII